MLESPFGEALDAEFGTQLRALKRCQATTFVPEIKDELAEEASLVSEYTRLMAGSEADFRGQKISLSKLPTYFGDADRAVRLDAHRALDACLAANREALDSIFHRLVELRHRMGTTLGHANYVPLAYQLRSRMNYGPDDVAAFRDAIARYIVPIASELRERQAAALGLSELLYHDETVWDAGGNARPQGDSGDILAAAQRMYNELHPELGEFFSFMNERGLLDVELRDGKAGGGFCTSLIDLGLPFVFANFNGSDGDLMVITHECGHAFQAYCSRQLEPRVEYIFPTFEAAEIHSMSMEFLTYPWMELFFGERADSYRRTHLRKAICMLPYIAAVDHFQHDVYGNPEWTPAQRNSRWSELEALYLPHRSYGEDYPYLAQGGLWQRQRHIYSMPFYYIDYGLAQVCAMQLWQRAEKDREGALGDFFTLCRAGGSIAFLDMVDRVGLQSPFKTESLSALAERLRAVVANA
ncbi:MAG: M3 family oligoendopeptidase [Myxococcota bacterium]